MDEPRNFTKWSNSQRKRQMPYENTSMWNLKHDTHEPIYETDTYTENSHVVAKGEAGVRGMGVWSKQMQTTTYRMDKQGPTV